MTNGDDDPRVYQALALPTEALDNGGTEILRAGIVNDALYVTARRAFKDPGKWGEILAEVAERLGGIYAAEVSGLSKKDVAVQIAEAFAAEMGAKPMKAARKPPVEKTAKKKLAAKRKKR
jgi:uncharacterized protein DUF5076